MHAVCQRILASFLNGRPDDTRRWRMWVPRCRRPGALLVHDRRGEPFHLQLRQGLRLLLPGACAHLCVCTCWLTHIWWFDLTWLGINQRWHRSNAPVMTRAPATQWPSSSPTNALAVRASTSRPTSTWAERHSVPWRTPARPTSCATPASSKSSTPGRNQFDHAKKIRNYLATYTH